MKIFIDFDDVLFNTGKFVVGYKAIFKSHGISDKVYKKYYYDYPVNKGKKFKSYNWEIHIREISKRFPLDVRKIKSDITDFIKNTGKYVFRDVYEFVRKFSKKDLYLISFPRIKFQETKIKNSGISKYFKRVVLTSSLKSTAISKLIAKEKIKKNEAIYFIDDRLEIIEDMKKKLPRVIAIFLKRKEGRHKYPPGGNFDYEARNLREAGKIIKNLN